MTNKELKKLLQKYGWKFHEGAKHEQAKHPDKPGVKISIQRGTGEIPIGTLNQILKDAGLK